MVAPMSKLPFAGRDELAAMVATKGGMPLAVAKRCVSALFGTGGAGKTEGPRNCGAIEELLKKYEEVRIRGFGSYRRSVRKARESNIAGIIRKCRQKSKLSFTASMGTDEYPDENKR